MGERALLLMATTVPAALYADGVVERAAERDGHVEVGGDRLAGTAQSGTDGASIPGRRRRGWCRATRRAIRPTLGWAAGSRGLRCPCRLDTIREACSSSAPSEDSSTTVRRTRIRDGRIITCLEPSDDTLDRVVGRAGHEYAGPDGGHVGESSGDDRGDYAASERGLELREPTLVVYLEADTVAGQAQSEPSRDAGREVSTVGGGRYQHRRGRAALDEVGEDRRVGLGIVFSQRAVAVQVDGVGSVGGQQLNGGSRPRFRSGRPRPSYRSGRRGPWRVREAPE